MNTPKPAPFFSIITVVCNDHTGLARTHRSITTQDWRDLEWIAVDGGSNDGSREYLETHSADLTWWRSTPDGGPFDAMNHGLAKARGRYLLFLNAGDSLAAPDTLARIAEAADTHHTVDFLYGDALEKTTDGRYLYKPARSHLMAWYGMFAHHQAMFYRHDSIGSLRYSLSYRVGADYAFTLAFLTRSRHVVRVDGPVCVFAQGGLAETNAAEGRQDGARIRRDVLGWGRTRRTAVMAVQWATMSIRRAFPILYESARCRPVSSSDATPDTP